MSSKLNIAQLRTLKTILKSYEDYLSSAAISSDKKELILPETNNEFSDIFQGLTSVILNSKQRLHDLSQQNKALKNTANNYAELLNELQTIAHIGTWEWNIEKDIIICSDAVLKIFEIHKRKKIKYQTLLDYTHPEDVRIVDYIFKKAFFDHRSFKIHQRIILNDGKIKFLEVRGAVEANKKDVPLKMYGTIQDISKLKETKDQLFLIKQQLEAKVDERTRDLKRAYRNLENEMELKENAQLKEKELADIVESSEDAIIGKTIDGVIKSWNKGAQKMYGFTEDEMIGTHVNKIIPNSKIKEFEKALTKILTGKKVNSFQTKRQTKTGELLDVSLSISPIKNRIGEVIGFSEITRDITDEINANKRFEVAVEASPNGMIMINEDGKIVMANRQTEKMFGYKHNELIGHSIDKLIPSNLKPTSKSKKTIDSLYQIHGRELFGTQKDGKKIIVEIGLNPIENKEGKFILASVVDITSRKKFEQELKESEEKYRTLIDTMNEGVLILDNHEKILFANDFMCKMLEYEIDELIGKRADKLLLDSEGKKEMQIIIDLHKKGKSSKYEIQLITKSGNKLWMLVSGAPTYNSIGELTGSVSLHTNITSRKLMEEELNSIANIPEENPNPTFRFSIHGQVLMYANPASINTLNFFDDEANRDIRQEWVKQINKVYQIGKPVKKELTVKEQTFMCTIVPVPENKYVNVYAVDITATKEAEAEIKKLSLVLSKTENAVVIADKNGIIQWVNEGFKKITGYPMNEVVGTNGEQLRRGKKTGLNKKHPYFIKMLKTKQSMSYESRNFKKSGEEYWAITTLTPVFDGDQLESIIAIDTDITEKKLAEKEILRAKKIAEDSAKAKELFLANMSHEIRTPMNAIMGIIQLLRDTELSKTQLEYLKSMDFAGENLLRIINDVLDLAKIDSGKMGIEKIPFDLNELIQDLFNSISHRAHEKGIQLLKEIDTDVPTKIIGDPVRLNQILINLISNGIKFTNEGYIKILIKSAKPVKNQVKITFQVQDTGIGIAKDKHALIFSDFEQANKETTRKYGGTGLGLSIVKRLLKIQGGSINLKSKVGEGSTFTFTLPFDMVVKNKPKKVTEQQNLEDDNVLNNKNVLLVEDNMLNQMVATKFLESMGLKVCVANNGQEGVDHLQNSDFDIVLMDIQMPIMDGYTATHFIRKSIKGKKSKTPILAMTAHAISGEKEKCLGAGMNDYIAKPLKREHLKLKIINLIKN